MTNESVIAPPAVPVKLCGRELTMSPLTLLDHRDFERISGESLAAFARRNQRISIRLNKARKDAGLSDDDDSDDDDDLQLELDPELAEVIQDIEGEALDSSMKMLPTLVWLLVRKTGVSPADQAAGKWALGHDQFLVGTTQADLLLVMKDATAFLSDSLSQATPPSS